MKMNTFFFKLFIYLFIFYFYSFFKKPFPSVINLWTSFLILDLPFAMKEGGLGLVGFSIDLWKNYNKITL